MKLKAITAAALSICASHAMAIPSLDFMIDGDTYAQPFSILNSSTNNEKVTRFQLDLRPATNICFDPAGDSSCDGSSGVSFNTVGGTAATTGYVSGQVSNEVGGVDAWDFLDISFNDFDSGETFKWDIDTDFFQNTGPATTYGSNLIGALALIDFSDGQRLTGYLAAVDGNSDASRFTVTGIGATPVSEPGTIALLGLGLAGIAGFRRKK